MKRQRDEAHNERDVLSAMLRESRAERESTRDALGAGPVEHVVDAAKRVMAELEEVRKRAAQFEAELDEAWEATGVSSTVRGMTDLADVVRSDKRSAKFVREERDDLRVALNEATRQRDEARREAARDREADRRMLDPRALWIADKTWDLQMRFLRVETREDGKSGWSACDASEFVAFATETLRVAEHHAPAPPFRASSSRSLTRASSRSAVRGEEGGGQVSDQTKPALPTLAEIEAEPAD